MGTLRWLLAFPAAVASWLLFLIASWLIYSAMHEHLAWVRDPSLREAIVPAWVAFQCFMSPIVALVTFVLVAPPVGRPILYAAMVGFALVCALLNAPICTVLILVAEARVNDLSGMTGLEIVGAFDACFVGFWCVVKVKRVPSD